MEWSRKSALRDLVAGESKQSHINHGNSRPPGWDRYPQFARFVAGRRQNDGSSSQPAFLGLVSLARLCVVVITTLILVSCNDVSGDQSGGAIDDLVIHFEPGPLDTHLPQWILKLRNRYSLGQADMLRLAGNHCQTYPPAPHPLFRSGRMEKRRGTNAGSNFQKACV